MNPFPFGGTVSKISKYINFLQVVILSMKTTDFPLPIFILITKFPFRKKMEK